MSVRILLLIFSFGKKLNSFASIHISLWLWMMKGLSLWTNIVVCVGHTLSCDLSDSENKMKDLLDVLIAF